MPPPRTDLAAILSRTLGCEAFLVGGAVRDSLMGRFSPDLDIILPEKKKGFVRSRAAEAAKALEGGCFTLDEETLVYRISVRNPFPFQVDISAFQGPDLESDLRRRDFTANALAYPLTDKCATENAKCGKPGAKKLKISNSKSGLKITGLEASRTTDPCRGREDIRRGIIRIAGPEAFREDPLRTLRAFRCAAELGWELSSGTLAAVKAAVPLLRGTAPERIHDELLHLLAADNSACWLKKMDGTGLLTAVFPELEPQRKCAEVYYGRDGVLKHSIRVVDRVDYLFANAAKIFSRLHGRLLPFLREKSNLKLAALLHDLGKPPMAKKVKDRLRFFGHEEKGAEMAGAIMQRLRFSRSEIRFVSRLTLHHLRPGNLAANNYISDKAVYRFFRDLGEDGIPLLLLCWADHTSYLSIAELRSIEKEIQKPPFPIPSKGLPAQGPVKTLRYLQVVNLMLSLYLDRSPAIVQERLVDGRDIMNIMKIPPGPDVGKVLEKIRDAQADGKICCRRQALDYLRKLARP
ncbi:MAG: HD domain-containing protein [bacterium]